jgi:hypothetical protein
MKMLSAMGRERHGEGERCEGETNLVMYIAWAEC